MTHPNKSKGNRYERELIATLTALGFTNVRRAWGSDGRSLGHHADVDVVGEYGGMEYTIQAKRRKVVPKWLNPGNAFCMMFRSDRGESYITIKLSRFIECLKNAR